MSQRESNHLANSQVLLLGMSLGLIRWCDKALDGLFPLSLSYCNSFAYFTSFLSSSYIIFNIFSLLIPSVLTSNPDIGTGSCKS